MGLSIRVGRIVRSPNLALMSLTLRKTYPMKTTLLFRRGLAFWQLLAALTLTGGAAFAAPTVFNSYNIDSDILGVAHDTDPLLINPWGLTTGVEGNLRVSDDGTGFSTIYGQEGALLSNTSGMLSTHSIAIPQSMVTTGTTGSPTGVDVNLNSLLDPTLATDFPITDGTTSSSHYLYCTEDGAVEGYRDTVNLDSAIIGNDQSTAGAGYTGIALSWVFTSSTTPLAHQLYAANFAKGKIDVFNSSWGLVALTGSDTFTDPSPPNVPSSAPVGSSWSPFNIHRVDYVSGKGKSERRLLVVYALHNAVTAPLNDIPGAGYGYADLFDPDGAFVMRFINANKDLNSPWGIAVAHGDLGKFKAPLVIFVGNHGDGGIHAYAFDPKFSDLDIELGTLKNDEGNALAFDGLWALHFGTHKITFKEYMADPSDLTEDRDKFFFSAGIVGETHGLVGRIYIP